ncbi:protein kinase [Apiospora hydei]|uniref:Protein kinase n=1 Tax=Apiospora hydei TaxID=1337664 RepID=A0ABR1WBN0_9PEZI
MLQRLQEAGFSYTRPADMPKPQPPPANDIEENLSAAQSTTEDKNNWSLVWDEASREFHFYNASNGAKRPAKAEQSRQSMSNARSFNSASSPQEAHPPSLQQIRDALEAALLGGYDLAISQILVDLALVTILLTAHKEGSPPPLLDRVTGTRALGQAVDKQNFAIAKELLAHGVRCDFEASDRPHPHRGGINQTNHNFSPHDESEPAEYIPPLVRAVRHGNMELVQLLLAHGADPNVGYHDLWLPGAGREKELPWDCEDPTIQFTCGRPVQLAMELGLRDVVDVLLDRGADIGLPQPVWGVPGHECGCVLRSVYLKVTAGLRGVVAMRMAAQADCG